VNEVRVDFSPQNSYSTAVTRSKNPWGDVVEPRHKHNHHREHKHLHVYQSKAHLFVTFLTLLVPFIFLAIFSQFAKIAITDLFTDTFVSLWRMLLAYLVAVILGWLFAVLFYKGHRGKVALPFFDVLQSIPTFAILPLVTYFVGPSNWTVIFFIMLNIIWPVFFSIISSLKLMKHDWQESVQIYGLKGWSYFRYYLLPVTWSGLITGSIIGLGDGWEALIATEIIVGMKNGLGSFFNANSTNVGITLFGTLGFLILIFALNKIIWLPLLDWSHKKTEE
jgi:ABC-type nitrate/sulfonate/bicarbonate transport system permease component